MFALIELLGGPAGDQLNAFRDGIRFGVEYQQMDVVGSDNVVEYPQAEAFLGFEEPGMPTTSVLGEFQEEFFLVAAVGDVPHLSGNMMSVRSRHYLEDLF